ncbi:MAG: hypothetical protein JXM70_12930, partial [Pirellulales bacterium]|nr:hypothetical protein [Pirellulales bacterium]
MLLTRHIFFLSCCLLISVPNNTLAEVEVQPIKPSVVVSLDGQWLLAIDPGNVGCAQSWWQTPRPEAKTTKVPWIIQEAFPGYHGVAWYWRTFTPPKQLHANGRYLLRFWAVDYQAEVWLNGVHLGGHEGGEGMFILDITKAIKPQGPNLLAVRVLNPTNESIDGIKLAETPHRCKMIPFRAGALYNDGGIVDSVELLVAPPVRIDNLVVRPDPKTGKIAVEAKVHSFLAEAVPVEMEFTVSPAASGETLKVVRVNQSVKPGDSQVKAILDMASPRLWQLNDPYLYRITARVHQASSDSFDEQSARCGFRDFRFEKGYFRLNGERIFLKCSHTSTHYPIGLHYPHDPDLARRDLLLSKAMGFNAIRFFCAVPTRYQLDLCDELGLMVYQESYAGWLLEPSLKLPERFDREITEMILRDRNHPSIVMWGLVNETSDGDLLRHAAKTLPLVRALDETRVVMLNSGMFNFVQGRNQLEGISMWRGDVGQEPNITFNGSKGNIQAVGALWEPGRLALHPGQKGEYCVLRWTAPADGEYLVDSKFASIAQHATTDVHVLHQSNSLFSSAINLPGHGSASSCKKTVVAKTGDTIDFAVGYGSGGYGGDTTGIDATIVAKDKTTHDASRDFSIERNPQGVWSFGYFQPGASPDAATFKRFTMGETIASPECPWGTLSNPQSKVWENLVSDQHPYKRVPHTAGIIRELRTAAGHRDKPVFVSEYGIGSGVDLAKTTRHFEQLGAEELEDAHWYRQRLDQFLADWRRWNLDDTFASPEDFFALCLAKMGQQRLLGINAIRANPKVVGYSMTGTVDQANCGEGLFTTFRDLKPGTIDCVADGWYPLRWCLFVEPVNVYRKTPVRLEAVLADEDMLKSGEYPVNLRVVGPEAKCVFDRTIKVTVPARSSNAEPPMATAVFAEDVVIDGPPGKYRFLVTFKRGAAAAGGETEFYVADPADLPKVETEVVLWGG